MEADLQKRIAEAKAQGFTDEEIRQALQTDTGQTAAPAANVGGYDVPVLSAEEKARLNQTQQAIEESNTRQNIETGAVAAGLGAAALGVPAALYYGGKAILSPAARAGAELAQRGVTAAENIGKTMGATEQRVASNQQMARQMAAQRAAAAAPAAQPAPGYGSVRYNVPTQAMPPSAGPVTGPVAPAGAAPMPTAAPTPAAQPNMIQRGTEYVRQLAMNRILPAAGQMVRGGGVTSAALYTPELGPKVPSTGRMRGMEINPLTRRPWTPDQLAAYERNPQMFDSQLPPAQMPR